MLCIHNSKLVSQSLTTLTRRCRCLSGCERGEGGKEGLQQRVEMCSGDDG